MSDISLIRTLAGDPIQYDRSGSTGDGATTRFQVPNYPVVAGSQVVTVGGLEKTEDTDYTFDDDLGVCVLTVAPAQDESVIITYTFSLLSDTQLQELLDNEDGDVKMAAAAALDSIAASQALIQKKIKTLDLQTDGPALAESLHNLAKDLRDQAAGIGDPVFDIAEEVYDGRSYREKRRKDWMRS